PAAVDHAVALRGNARRRAGGLDAASYASWYAALIDLSLRLSGLGWRNALCETAFVARGGEGGPADGDLDALAVRWPAWHARLANFLMEDPLRETREALTRSYAGIDPPQAQRELFVGETRPPRGES
ncbi:MAG: glycosyltransferase, partial [Luteimonas sp.]|nr:glycosyltransferase [Luteimonas sp.]